MYFCIRKIKKLAEQKKKKLCFYLFSVSIVDIVRESTSAFWVIVRQVPKVGMVLNLPDVLGMVRKLTKETFNIVILNIKCSLLIN